MRSIRCPLGYVLGFATLCIALQATSCAVSKLRNDRFTLAACPPAGFVLPTEIRDGPYHLVHDSREGDWGGRALDTTFTTYAFTDINVSGFGPRPVALRLVRDTTCTLDVLREVRGPDSVRTEQSVAIARAVAGSGGTRSLEPGRSERILVDELQAWTMRTAAPATVRPQPNER